jgi:RNA-directed DNA polymerase
MTISDDILFPRVVSWDNLLEAYRKAARGKRGKQAAATFEFQFADRLLAVQDELAATVYRPGAYQHFTIREPKKRLISAAPFRDRVVHHALCNVIEPLFEARFHPHSYANRISKGTHRAVDQLQAYARRYRYALRLDVVQHFASLDHAVLKAELFRVVHDAQAQWLIEQILHSGAGVLDTEYEMVYFPGDDLLAANRPRGLPIGNLTSQFWANVYLNNFDHFVKRDLKCPAYLRYVEDFLLFGDDKRVLLDWRAAIIEKMAALRLTLHEERAQVFPTETGIPFLGFRVYPDHRLVKRRKVVHFRRKLRRQLEEYSTGGVSISKLNASIQGWVNHVRYGDTWGLRKAVLGEISI